MLFGVWWFAAVVDAHTCLAWRRSGCTLFVRPGRINCTICCGCARRHTVCACVQLLAVLWQVSDSLRCGDLEFRCVFSCASSSEGYVPVFRSCAYAASVELTRGSDLLWWLVVNAECHRPSVMQGQTCNMRLGCVTYRSHCVTYVFASIQRHTTQSQEHMPVWMQTYAELTSFVAR
jgi:hypothetical protein